MEGQESEKRLWIAYNMFDYGLMMPGKKSSLRLMNIYTEFSYFMQEAVCWHLLLNLCVWRSVCSGKNFNSISNPIHKTGLNVSKERVNRLESLFCILWINIIIIKLALGSCNLSQKACDFSIEMMMTSEWK